MILIDIFFGRVILYISPLCPILAPFFSDYSIILKTHKVIENYSRASKAVCQVILTLNRMTCTMFPMSHQWFWDKFKAPILLLNFLLPFGAIWSLILSRVYGESTAGGFATSYKRAISWASLSRLQTIYITISIFATLIFTAITLHKLKSLRNRQKSAELCLCFVTFWITIGFCVVCSFWFLWVFCADCSYYYPSLFLWQFVSYDFLNVSTPIVMILINKQLRNQMFSRFFSTNKMQINHVTIVSELKV
ncbi:unnamed protein product [Caenorhabditis angaria]|uniref:Serpentine receptor class gamma n=1 Tax=Caenorhabditis angaria TaxID=860376 RepID=A0A9P1IHZ9_9PELO|nr:unnamed protein product [Caenorhabditis angaria]